MKLNLLFVLIGLVGFGCIYPLAFRTLPEKRKLLLIIGTVLLHISVFGLMRTSVPTYVIISFLLLETGIITLWDPLKLLNESHRRRAVIAGIVCIAASILLSLAKLTLFPLWLWLIPIGLYLAAVLISSENKYHYYAMILAATLTLGYLTVMIKKAYDLSQTTEATVAVPVTGVPTLPASTSSGPSAPTASPRGAGVPLSNSMSELDRYIRSLEDDKRRLEAEVIALQGELDRLRQDTQKKNEKIEEIKDISESL